MSLLERAVLHKWGSVSKHEDMSDQCNLFGLSVASVIFLTEFLRQLGFNGHPQCLQAIQVQAALVFSKLGKLPLPSLKDLCCSMSLNNDQQKQLMT